MTQDKKTFKNISEAWNFLYGNSFGPSNGPLQRWETERAFMVGAMAMFEIVSRTENVSADDFQCVYEDLVLRVAAFNKRDL